MGPSSPSPKRDTAPIFGPFLLWPNGWMHQDATWYGGRSRPKPHCAVWAPSSPPTKMGHSPQFLPHVYCGQTAGWTKMPLGMHTGHIPGEFVLDGDPAPPRKKGTAPTQFSAHVYCGQTAGWTKMPLSMQAGHSPGEFVLDGDPARPIKKAQLPPNFRPMSVVAKRLDGEDATWYGSRPRPWPHCVRRGPSSPCERGTAVPPFSAHVYCRYGRPSQLLLSSCLHYT